jgi:hypothetical protein
VWQLALHQAKRQSQAGKQHLTKAVSFQSCLVSSKAKILMSSSRRQKGRKPQKPVLALGHQPKVRRLLQLQLQGMVVKQLQLSRRHQQEHQRMASL